MGILDGIADFFQDVLDFIADYLLEILIIVAIVLVAIYFPGVLAYAWELGAALWGEVVAGISGMASMFASFGIEGAIAAATGISILLNPEESGEMIGEVVESGGTAAGSVISDVLSSGPGMLLVGGVVLWLVLSSGSSKKKRGDDVTAS